MVYATRSINYYSATGYSGESYSTTQPEGFSALCGTAKMYLNYRVLSSKIRVSFNPTSTADNLFACVTATAIGTQSTTTIWTASQAPNSSPLATFTSIEQRQNVSKGYTTAHVFGVPENAIRVNDDYAGTSGSSPASEWAWVVQWQIIDNTTSNAVMGVRVEMEYDVEFFKPTTGGLPDTYSKVPRCPDATGTTPTLKYPPPKILVAALGQIEPEAPPKIAWADQSGQEEPCSTPDDLVWLNGSQYLRVGAPLHDHARVKTQ